MQIQNNFLCLNFKTQFSQILSASYFVYKMDQNVENTIMCIIC